MTDAFAGYDEPAAPDRKLATDRRTRGADSVDLQQICLFDKTAENGAAVSAAGRLSVDASGVAVPVTDNAGSLTVDAPVGTPVFVRLSDGSSAIATLAVDTELPAAAALADGAANPTTPLVGGATLGYNNSAANWDRWRNNAGTLILASGARTTTQNNANSVNFNWRGCHLCVNVTSAGTGSITPIVQGLDATGSAYYDLHAAATPITANGQYVYEIYPGVGAVSGGITQATSRVLPRNFRVVITANNANSMTYSVLLNGIV